MPADDFGVYTMAGAILGVMVAAELYWVQHPGSQLPRLLDEALAYLELLPGQDFDGGMNRKGSLAEGTCSPPPPPRCARQKTTLGASFCPLPWVRFIRCCIYKFSTHFLFSDYSRRVFLTLGGIGPRQQARCAGLV